MENQDFSTSFLVAKSAGEAYKAIVDPRAWWSEEIEGTTDEINAEWSYHYKDLHRCKMKVVELIPDKRVAWLVTENYFNFVQDQNEWIGTRVILDISEEGDQTRVRFTHEGLIPKYECYEICSNAWSGYVNNSLRQLIETGTGMPNRGQEITSHEQIGTESNQ
ncbi:SRPBCC domain-containing protein [Dyadobacter chenwenxiniae]|uniref:SRPBCC domain-containing protein n=1 Tax=Dyadobacter chenwenxiniae TaxID=2906456 RepID=A0A9X1PQP2_9BACT|nr:SRPBCC domain-containing protein [Dyadobacter chenwenxiniae]MCF0065273.1 SRPBCC domain-containing protein [Dyadobacter chenwenxiniae]UON84459.1 SRPBCC domain-containing protein [Dyadobacter chenwenxiniae]